MRHHKGLSSWVTTHSDYIFTDINPSMPILDYQYGKNDRVDTLNRTGNVLCHIQLFYRLNYIHLKFVLCRGDSNTHK